MRAILFFMCSMMMACIGTGEEARATKVASRTLLGKAQAQEWQLAQWYDPYNQGYTVPADSSHPKYLILLADGGFIQYQGANYNDGEWLLSADSKKMALVHTIQNGTRIPAAKRDTSYRYQILRHTEDTLKLGIQGRHGIVEYTYIPAQKSLLPQPANKP